MSASARNLLACHSHIFRFLKAEASSQTVSTQHPPVDSPHQQPAVSRQPASNSQAASQQTAVSSQHPPASHQQPAASTSQPAVASIPSEPASQRSGSLFVHLSVSSFVCFWLAGGWLPLLAGCGWLVGGCLWLASWLVGRLATAFC